MRIFRALAITVALTGGIASGKSAASDRFAALGADVIANDGTLADLDDRVRQLHERYLALAQL